MADISKIILPDSNEYNLKDTEARTELQTTLRGNAGGVFHGTCSSSASATAKVVTCSDFKSTNLVAGAIIIVSFSATNSGTVGSLTLNVNSTGAKPIKYINNGTLGNLSSAGYLKASTSYPFIYDGTNWIAIFNYNTTYSSMTVAEYEAGTGTTARNITPERLKAAILLWASSSDATKASTSNYGITKLSTATNSTATDLAATPSAVKSAYDLADTANTGVGQLSGRLDDALIFNTTYTMSGTQATFTAKVYCCGEDVTSDYAPACFTWYKRTSQGISQITGVTGTTYTIDTSTLGYGASIIARFNSEGGNA